MIAVINLYKTVRGQKGDETEKKTDSVRLTYECRVDDSGSLITEPISFEQSRKRRRNKTRFSLGEDNEVKVWTSVVSPSVQ